MNLKLLNFALSSLLRKKVKNLATFFAIYMSVFLVTSVLFVSISLKNMILASLDIAPEITVQKIVGGRQDLIETDRVEKLKELAGVVNAEERIWGYYFLNHQNLKNGGVNFTLLGIDIYSKNRFQNAIDANFDAVENGGMVVGESAKEVLEKVYFKEFLNFVTPKNSIVKVPIIGTFKSEFSFESSDFLVVSKDRAREILGVPYNRATDIVLGVANPDEVDTVAQKINLIYPDTRTLTKKDLKAVYEGLFDYKSGLFLALFLIGGFVFFMLIYEKASGLNETEKKEIGILKAIGWRIGDVMGVKFIEHALLASFAFGFALCSSYIFVFMLDAPLLRDIFIGNSELFPPFELALNIELLNIAGLAFVFLALYLALILLPIWKSATTDATEAMR